MVYPRVDGGTRSCHPFTDVENGLSPRGRGNRRVCHSNIPLWRSIPAWTGEPATATIMPPSSGVYPRVDGGTRISPASPVCNKGLSPRGRGNRWLLWIKNETERSIPAWTGEPQGPNPRRCIHPVYPRVDGGTPPQVTADSAMSGLSPRGRGNLVRMRQLIVSRRSIPAWTGEPGRAQAMFKAKWVYPRVDGGTMCGVIALPAGAGLSPRGRGNHRRRIPADRRQRSIPAWTGEPLFEGIPAHATTVYPRVDGGTLSILLFHHRKMGLSPRGRGNPNQ